MARIQIQITEKQSKAIKQIALQQGVSMAQVMRSALDKVIEREHQPSREKLKKRAIEVVGSVHSDITDLSIRHDHYFDELCD